MIVQWSGNLLKMLMGARFAWGKKCGDCLPELLSSCYTGNTASPKPILTILRKHSTSPLPRVHAAARQGYPHTLLSRTARFHEFRPGQRGILNRRRVCIIWGKVKKAYSHSCEKLYLNKFSSALLTLLAIHLVGTQVSCSSSMTESLPRAMPCFLALVHLQAY